MRWRSHVTLCINVVQPGKDFFQPKFDQICQKYHKFRDTVEPLEYEHQRTVKICLPYPEFVLTE